MATHVSVFSCRPVGKIVVILRHKQTVDVGPDRDTLDSTGRCLLARPMNISDEPSLCTLLDVFDPVAGQSLQQLCLRLYLLEMALWELVEVLSQLNQRVDIAAVLLQNFLVSLVVLRKVCLSLTSELHTLRSWLFNLQQKKLSLMVLTLLTIMRCSAPIFGLKSNPAGQVFLLLSL